MKARSAYLLPLTASLALGTSGAQAADDTAQLESVHVESTRTARDQEAPHSRFATPQSLSAEEVFTREDIEAIRPRDVLDLVETAAGMSLQRQGARVHSFSYDRGDNVSIIVDGVYLSTTQAQRVIGDLSVEMIERIRFVRDSTVLSISPLMSFGSANAGSPNQGFILIETRGHRRADTATDLRASYATYDTWKTAGYTGLSWLDDRARLSASYEHAQSHGKPDWNNAYQGDTALLSGGWRDAGFTAAATLYANRAERDIQRAIGTYTGTTGYPVSGPTPQGVLDKNIWKYDPMDTTLFALDLARPWNARHTTALTYGWTEAEGTQYMYTTTTPRASIAGKQARDQTEEWNLSHTIADGSNTFKLGLQSVYWYQLTEGNAAPRRERIYGVYATDEIQWTPHWSIDATARMDKKRVLEGGDKYRADGASVRLSSGTWTDEATLLSIGSAWRVNPTWRLSARYSFNRTPTPDVLTTVNDATLPAERRGRTELGVEAQFGPALQASFTPFYYDLRNAKVAAGTVTTAPDGSPLIDAATGLPTSVTVYGAADRIRKGFELNLKGRFLDDRLGYTLGWTRFLDDSQNGATGNEQPGSKYSARGDWRHGPWNTSLSLLHVDPYRSYNYVVGDFTTVNLSVARSFDHGVTLTVYAQNLTDEEYGTMNKGYPATANWGVLRDVGATYGVELAVRF